MVAMIPCACGCGRPMTARQLQRGNVYSSRQCAGVMRSRDPRMVAWLKHGQQRMVALNRERFLERTKQRFAAEAAPFVAYGVPAQLFYRAILKAERRAYQRGWAARWMRERWDTARGRRRGAA